MFLTALPRNLMEMFSRRFYRLFNFIYYIDINEVYVFYLFLVLYLSSNITYSRFICITCTNACHFASIITRVYTCYDPIVKSIKRTTVQGTDFFRRRCLLKVVKLTHTSEIFKHQFVDKVDKVRCWWFRVTQLLIVFLVMQLSTYHGWYFIRHELLVDF